MSDIDHPTVVFPPAGARRRNLHGGDLAEAFEKRVAAERPDAVTTFDPDDIDILGGGWVLHKASQMMYRIKGAGPPVAEAVVAGRTRLLHLPARGEPHTFEAWHAAEERRTAVAEAAAQAAEQRRVIQLQASPRRPVTAEDLRTAGARAPLPTPYTAAALVAHHQGQLAVDDQLRLRIELPGMLLEPLTDPDVAAAIRTLYLCEGLVVEHVTAGTPLPDRPLTPGGAPLP